MWTVDAPDWDALLLALKAFEGHAEGDLFYVQLDERWAHLAANDYVRVMSKWLRPSLSD